MATIPLSELTNATTISDGTGALDIILKTLILHLDDQFTKDRLTGTEYAQVLLGSIQAATTEANKFVLQNQAADKQADLLAEQILTEQAKAANHAKQWKLSLLDRIGNYDAMRANSVAITGGDVAFKQLANHVGLGIDISADTDLFI